MGWAVTPVRESKDSRGALGGAGFTLADQDGRQCITFGYPTIEAAREALRRRSGMQGRSCVTDTGALLAPKAARLIDARNSKSFALCVLATGSA